MCTVPHNNSINMFILPRPCSSIVVVVAPPASILLLYRPHEQSFKRVKHPPVKLDTCSICLNEFAASSDQLRLLPCLHSLCRSCGIDLINQNEQKNTLTCPECQQSHIFDHPNIEKDASILIDRCPTYHQAWNRNEHLRPTEPAAAASSSSTSTSATDAAAAASSSSTAVKNCTVAGCSKLASHNCLFCSYQCSEHEHSFHLDRPAHIRISLDEQRKKQQEEEVRLQNKCKEDDARIIRRLERAKSMLNHIQLETDGLNMEITKDIKSYRDSLDDEAQLLNDLARLVNTLNNSYQDRRALLQSVLDDTKQLTNRIPDAIKVKRSDLDHSLKLTLGQRLKMTPTDMHKLIDLSSIEKQAALFREGWTRRKPIAPDAHPLMTLLRDLKSPTLLPTLPPNLKDTLQGMLVKSGKSFVNAALLYRANWDGWTKKDFIRCCQGKSDTLLLVKVARIGRIFGAYLAPAWPNGPAIVPDGGQSFVFSLLNQYTRYSFRLSLREPTDSALCVSAAIDFGGPRGIKPFNFSLFNGNRPGNDPRGNSSNPQNTANYVYQLDEASKKSAPKFFQLDNNTFGGSEFFGASEIEVYQLL